MTKLQMDLSISEIDNDRWLIGNQLLLSRQSSIDATSSSSGKTVAAWSDGKGSFFMLSECPVQVPASHALPNTSEIQKVHSVGEVSTVWRVGEAFVKVKEVLPGATREHVTLQYLLNKKMSGFKIPRVYHHWESDGKYYIVLQSLPGQTLGDRWPTMDESTRQSYVCRIAEICSQLKNWQGNSITGVDGNQLCDEYLQNRAESCDPQHLLRQCQKLHMDCSTLVFYHCDLGPGNIIIDRPGDIGIIDWETAGFVPREWIRTKFCVSSGLNLPTGSSEDGADWRRRVSRRLADMGYKEVADEWMAQWNCSTQ